MARKKKPAPQPQRPDPFSRWGNVPVDDATERDRLAEMLPAIADREAFDKGIWQVSHNLHWDLSEKERFNPPAVYGALAEAETRLREALASLDALGFDASRELGSQAAKQDPCPPGDNGETIWQWLEPRPLQRDGIEARASGRSRIEWVKRAMHDCARWSRSAKESVDKRALPSNRPPAIALRDAISGLIEIWERQSGKRPTIASKSDKEGRHVKKYGAFLEFCAAVILPIYEQLGIKHPNIASAASRQVYPPNEKPKKHKT